MPESKRVALVVLAAGSSSRMGRPKQNLDWNGRTLLQATIDEAMSASAHGTKFGITTEICVVLGANEAAVRAANKFDGCLVLVNENWSEGLSTSIQSAVHHMETGSEAAPDAILFTVADLAYINGELLFKLLEKWSQFTSSIVCSAFADGEVSNALVYGVPAIFPRKFFSDLMTLSGDSGAKKIIERNTSELMSINVDEALFDVDTKDDYRQLLNQ